MSNDKTALRWKSCSRNGSENGWWWRRKVTNLRYWQGQARMEGRIRASDKRAENSLAWNLLLVCSHLYPQLLLLLLMSRRPRKIRTNIFPLTSGVVYVLSRILNSSHVIPVLGLYVCVQARSQPRVRPPLESECRFISHVCSLQFIASPRIDDEEEKFERFSSCWHRFYFSPHSPTHSLAIHPSIDNKTVARNHNGPLHYICIYI